MDMKAKADLETPPVNHRPPARHIVPAEFSMFAVSTWKV